jgi:hypothetical protein
MGQIYNGFRFRAPNCLERVRENLWGGTMSAGNTLENAIPKDNVLEGKVS